jgi:hypothetical protein
MDARDGHSLRRSPGFQANPRVGGVTSAEGRADPRRTPAATNRRRCACYCRTVAGKRPQFFGLSSLGPPRGMAAGERTLPGERRLDRPTRARAAIPRGEAGTEKGECREEMEMLMAYLYYIWSLRCNQRGTLSQWRSRGQITTSYDSLPLLAAGLPGCVLGFRRSGSGQKRPLVGLACTGQTASKTRRW